MRTGVYRIHNNKGTKEEHDEIEVCAIYLCWGYLFISFVQRTDHSGIFLEQKHTKKLKISSIFNHSEELTIHKGTPINETNAQVETHPLTVEMKIRKYSK